jgi:DnaJ family protein C protein 3
MRIFRLSYFFLPSDSPASALNTLKQCLHFDPDSKPCFAAHRLVKSLDKSFAKLDRALEAEDWRGIVTLVMGKDRRNPLGDGLLQQFEEAAESHTAPTLLSPSLSSLPLPKVSKQSPRRQHLVHSLCKAYTRLEQARVGEKWCDALLRMEGSEEDMDGLAGKGEAAIKREEWEEAVRLLGKAFEASGNSDRDVRDSRYSFHIAIFDLFFFSVRGKDSYTITESTEIT